jgi:hypothetical protein
MLTHGASANRDDDAVLAVMSGDARERATTAFDMRLRGDQQILTARGRQRHELASDTGASARLSSSFAPEDDR